MNRNRRGASTYPSDNDLEILRNGVDLAPQVSALRYQAAQAMMNRGQFGEAVFYLMPLANNPHGGDRLTEIRALLQQAMEMAGMVPAAGQAEPEAAPAPAGLDAQQSSLAGFAHLPRADDTGRTCVGGPLAPSR